MLGLLVHMISVVLIAGVTGGVAYWLWDRFAP